MPCEKKEAEQPEFSRDRGRNVPVLRTRAENRVCDVQPLYSGHTCGVRVTSRKSQTLNDDVREVALRAAELRSRRRLSVLTFR